MPVLNGPPGFILLTLAVGLGAYIRQVYLTAGEIYDKVESGQEPLWPRGATYTEGRLRNLLFVQAALRWVTTMMFIFIAASSFRLVLFAANAIDPIVSDENLKIYDLVLIGYLTVAFLFMWVTHWWSSANEREYHEQMRNTPRR